jgi:predicted transposase/invertase (TIGR01784 family)
LITQQLKTTALLCSNTTKGNQNMPEIYSIHDKVFKTALTDIRVARDFLEQHLPLNVQSAIDFNTLRITNESYITKELAAFSSDIVYQIRLKEKEPLAYIYILIEHQSSVDQLMPFRLWNYCSLIWDKYLKQTQSKTLPLIFPLVFYHGDTPYSGPRKIADLIQAPLDLIESALFGGFHLVDTHEINDDELRARKWAGIIQYVLKHVNNRNNNNLVETIIELLQGIDGEVGADVYGSTLLLYWFKKAATCKDPKEFLDAVAEGLSTRMGGEVMSMAEQWAARHKQEGIQQGMQLGEAQLLTNILKARFHDLPAESLKKIEMADVEDLNKWAINALSASSLSQVFQD